MLGRLILFATAAVAAVIPLLPVSKPAHALPVFPGWPSSLDGRALTPLPLGEGEKRFEADFPGKLGRFTDGAREIVIRWVTESTRDLHPSSDCYRYSGFEVKPLPLKADQHGRRWASFEAHRGKDHFRVFERLIDDRGNSWTDVSEWYWSALTAETEGPWWSYAWAERFDPGK